MGVLNVTPNSFSDGGRFIERDAAIAQALAMQAAGAIDLLLDLLLALVTQREAEARSTVEQLAIGARAVALGDDGQATWIGRGVLGDDVEQRWQGSPSVAVLRLVLRLFWNWFLKVKKVLEFRATPFCFVVGGCGWLRLAL